LEKAAAKVATKAGKSAVRGIASVAGALAAEWLAKKNASAEAVRIAIETKTTVDRAETLAAQRRKQELDDLDHAGLVQRRLMRLSHELLRQQENFEAIALRSLEIIENDPLSDKPRAIEDDWMFRFARLSEEVSDIHLRELWARILSSAAIDGKRKVSPAALQIMSLIDAKTTADFRKFCDVASTFTFFTGYDRIYEIEPQDIDLENLVELGLVAADPISGSYPFEDFELRVGAVRGAQIGVLKTTFSLTIRGAEIAEAILSDEILKIDEHLEQRYLQAIIINQIKDYYSVTIILPPKGQVSLPFALQIMHRRNPNFYTKLDLSSIKEFTSPRLWTLLNWADDIYEVMRVSHLQNPEH
jgi:hypothetical protein